MANQMDVHAVLQGEMRFDVMTGSGHQITMDSEEQDAGARPMELLLVALAGCSGMDIISILRKKRQQVSGYEIHIHGERAQEYPTVYTHIRVEHLLRGHQIDPVAVQHAIDLTEEKYCGVSATLEKTAKIVNTFQISEA